MANRADRPFYINHPITTVTAPYLASSLIGLSMGIPKNGICAPNLDYADSEAARRDWFDCCVVLSIGIPLCVLLISSVIVEVATRRFNQRQTDLNQPLIARI